MKLVFVKSVVSQRSDFEDSGNLFAEAAKDTARDKIDMVWLGVAVLKEAPNSIPQAKQLFYTRQ